MIKQESYSLVPANPPSDYIGSIDEWTMELIYRGHITEFYEGLLCHVEIEESEWLDVLKECENFIFDDNYVPTNKRWNKIKKGKK